MPVHRMIPLLSCAALLGALAGCAALGERPVAVAELQPRSGSAVAGSVSFAPKGGAVLVVARLTGLKPGEHGFHVHEIGDCSASDASSAKGHFNPGAAMHGHPHHHGERHAGDLPNLVADANGVADYRAEVQGLKLEPGPLGIIGRSVVVHADADDYRSQPAGNSGPRVACGVIAQR